MAGQIAELARDTLRGDFRTADSRSARILLVETYDRVLTTFPPSLSARAQRSLERIGVTPMLGSTVVEVSEEAVSVQDGTGETERIPARTVIWAAGVTASATARMLAEKSGAETDRAGRVTVEPDLTLPGHPEVFALGDMVRVRAADGSDAVVYPGVAPVAMQQGRYAASVIRDPPALTPEQPLPIPRQGQSRDDRPRRRGRRHQRPRAERLHGLGHLAGRAPVVLIGFQNRIVVFIRWSFSFVSHGRGSRLITAPGLKGG